MTTRLLTVVLKPWHERIFPETAEVSQILTCRQIMVWFISPVGHSCPSWDTMGLNRWKGGTGCYLVALCLSDQKARLSICSPNKLNLKFSIFQIPKQRSQVKGKSSRSSNLELSAQLTVDITSEGFDEPGGRGQEKEKQEEPTWCFILHAAVPFHGTHRAAKVGVPQSPSKAWPLSSWSQRVCNLLRSVQTFWIWFSVLHSASQPANSRGFWPIALAEAPQFR